MTADMIILHSNQRLEVAGGGQTLGFVTGSAAGLFYADVKAAAKTDRPQLIGQKWQQITGGENV